MSPEQEESFYLVIIYLPADLFIKVRGPILFSYIAIGVKDCQYAIAGDGLGVVFMPRHASEMPWTNLFLFQILCSILYLAKSEENKNSVQLRTQFVSRVKTEQSMLSYLSSHFHT